MVEINKDLMRVLPVNQQVKVVTLNCETYGGPHSFFDYPATVGNTQNIYAAGAYQGQNQPPAYKPPAYQALVYQALVHQPPMPQQQVVTTNEFTNFMKFMNMNTASPLGSGTLPSNTITNPKEDLKGITTRSGTAYQGPTIPTTSSSSFPLVEHETEVTKDIVHPTNNEITEDGQPLVVPTESIILNSEPVVASIIEPVASPDLNFNISFANALILMPNFGPSIKSLLTNKDKLCELARTPLNQHYSAVLLNKLPKKLGDPGKFLIPCDLPRMAECLALANLGTSINLMPLFVWNKLSLPDLSPTCMTLELANHSISCPVGVAEDVFVKGSYLKTGRALIDVFEGELILRVGKEAITFNLDQTSRYSANYNDMMANRIDVIDMAYEEYSQEVLSFFHVIARNYLPEVRKELKICEAKFDKSSIDEPPKVELKDLPPNLKYVFLEGDDKFPVIIAKDLSVEE
nr:reverse transcriptase domain-containing protein [Tanacetum cinerariifolium]